MEDIDTFGPFDVDFNQIIAEGPPAIYHGKLKCQVAGNARVAVMKLDATGCDSQQLERELRFLTNLGMISNVVQYKCHHFDNKRDLYLAMELYRKGSLDTFVRSDSDFETRRCILVHLMTGLDGIHRESVTHGFLKPASIHQSFDGKNIKIGGFGLSKPGIRESMSVNGDQIIRTWGSPEHYSRGEQNDKVAGSDIFSAGMIFHYVLSRGVHPFGSEEEPLRTIKDKIRNHNPLIQLGDSRYGKLAKQLILSMLEKNVAKRPSASTVLCHPLLWEEGVKQRCINVIQGQWRHIKASIKQSLLLQPLPENLAVATLPEMDDEHDPVSEDDYLLLYIFLHGMRREEPWMTSEDWNPVFELSASLQTFNEVTQCQEIQGIDFPEAEDLIDDVDRLQIEANGNTNNSQQESHTVTDEFVYDKSKPIKRGTMVYRGTIEGPDKIGKEEVVFKFIENTRANQLAIEVLSGCYSKGFISVQRSYEYKMPVTEERLYCMILVRYITTPFLKVLELNNIRHRQIIIKAIHHIVSCVCAIHGAEVAHGQISSDKFLLSRDGNYVCLIGSRKTKRLTSFDEIVIDVRDTAKVICDMIRNPRSLIALQSFENIQGSVRVSDWQDQNLLIDLLDKMWHVGDKFRDGDIKCKVEEYTQSLLTHPFFWGPDRKLGFWSDVYASFEGERDLNTLEANIPPAPQWRDKLKLSEIEREKWFPGDRSDGVVHEKATKPNSTYTDDATHSLLKLIRNCQAHLLHDMIKKHQSKMKLEGDQTLLKSTADVGEFFYSRFPDLFFDVYDFVARQEKYREKLSQYFTVQCVKRELSLPVESMQLE